MVMFLRRLEAVDKRNIAKNERKRRKRKLGVLCRPESERRRERGQSLHSQAARAFEIKRGGG